MTTQKSDRWQIRPPGSNWGDFGADDQCGRMNMLTPQKVLEGIREVREGLTFNLSLPLDYPGGQELVAHRGPPILRPVLRRGSQGMNYEIRRLLDNCTDVISDDLVILHLQYSTQWDGFAHAGQLFDAQGTGEPQALYYNGYRAGTDVVGPESDDDAGLSESTALTLHSTTNVKKLGIENMSEKCVQGRAVMIDLHAHYGRERAWIGYDELEAVMKADGVTVEPGDMVCLHTGWGEMIMEMARKPDIELLHKSCPVLDGRDQRLLQWVTDSGVTALIADNHAVEGHPPSSHVGNCATLPLHEHCLFKLGIHLGELWHLTPLANWLREHDRHRFLLTAPPLYLRGAVASPATPIATV